MQNTLIANWVAVLSQKAGLFLNSHLTDLTVPTIDDDDFESISFKKSKLQKAGSFELWKYFNVFSEQVELIELDVSQSPGIFLFSFKVNR